MDNRRYRHLILSPHLDDAALSCGGSIHRWATAGEPALVVTLMTVDPPDQTPSAFAEYQHDQWGLPAGQAYAVRRAEEAAALARLGADYLHLGFPDCIYRGDERGAFYTSEVDLFGPLHPADRPLIERLARALAALAPLAPQAAVYAPLGVGNHVDHQAVRRAAERWRGDALLYYEDYPYAGRLTGWEPAGKAFLVRLSQADVAAKVEAIAAYGSQMAVLFGGREPMEACVWEFSQRTAPAGSEGWAERFWHLTATGNGDTMPGRTKRS